MIIRLIWTTDGPAQTDDVPGFAMLTVRRPRWGSMLASIGLHVLTIAMLLEAPAGTHVQTQTAHTGLPFEVRIGGKLYYVVQTITPREIANTRVARRGGQSRSEAGSRTERRLLENAAAAAPRFVPPAMRSSAPGQVLLIEPDVAVLKVPPPEAIPRAIAWTGGRWKVPPKPFVEPGRVPNPAVQPAEEIAAADIVINDPTVRSLMNAKLPVTIAPAPSASPETGQPPSSVEQNSGDPVRVLAYGKRRGEDTETVTVPRGNRVPPAISNRAVDGQGGNGRGGSPQEARAAIPAADGAVHKGGSASGGTDPTGKGDTATATTAERGHGGEAREAGNAHEAEQRPGYGDTGDELKVRPTAATAASSSGVESTVSAKLTEPAEAARNLDKNPAYVRISRPADGAFDAVVVQTSGIQTLSEEPSPLTGQPIYTVYLSMGTAKDWILQYCVPREEIARATHGGNVISLAAPAPVRAPYPTVMYKPAVRTLPGDRYVVVQGLVTEAGRLEQTRIVHHGTADTDVAIETALAGWRFRPATRNGAPVSVEVLLAIPPDQL